jgi:hypothetical protein
VSCHERAVPASLVAAFAAIGECRRREHEQAGVGVEVTSLARPHGGSVARQDLVAEGVIQRESARVRVAG